jgi:hypothetical protein
MKKQSNKPMICNLEVLLMPNGEIICLGKTLGWFKEFKEFITKKTDISGDNSGESFAEESLRGEW